MGLYEIKYLQFKLFQKYPDLVHGVFTRSGGVSKGSFDSLNIGNNSGDDLSSVSENRKRILAQMGTKQAVFLNQVHGKEILVIKKHGDSCLPTFFSDKENRENPVSADGIVTDMAGISMVIQVADCQAILLFDPEKKVIANVHCGWQGSVENIISNCIDVMIKKFQCRPEYILAGISPSLGPCCAEFINFQDEIPRALWEYKEQDRPFFDFWKISRDQLMEKGVGKENIEIMNICTKCNTDKFFSFRQEKTTGRFACVLALNKIAKG
ncbi:MAG: multicopper polyphenol oxidase [Desulfobacteraceae bacterium 4572_89]|nr:MAG: multicopper polyphenol oxidase [Desulfobacteraceae bacterium 4572_89]